MSLWFRVRPLGLCARPSRPSAQNEFRLGCPSEAARPSTSKVMVGTPAVFPSARSFSASPTVFVKARRERRSDDPLSLKRMDKFDFDDLPTVGHLMMNRKRELVHYGRLVEWELPKLEAFQIPYTPPSKDCILRFRSIHYQGEAHPVTRKSVVTFDVADVFASGVLKSQAAKRKFLLLAGVRWDPFGRASRGTSLTGSVPGTREAMDIHNDPFSVEELALDKGIGSVKISCERFPEERQNLKWCSDVVDKMVAEANTNPETVADVPLDLRSARVREAKRTGLKRRQAPTIADFPKEWLP